MRPRTIEEFIGQGHIAGPGRLLRRLIQADRMSSIIFYGPPGTGKTTLAQVIANTTESYFITMNAVLDGVKNLRDAIAEAQNHRDLYGRRTILFVDEVHRWNKSQQDALLPWVENGTVILIGATTENPYFEVNKALVSRSRIFQLKSLTTDDLYNIARQALADSQRGYGRFDVQISEEALGHLVDISSGDARSLLNALELAVETSADKFPPEPGSAIKIDLQTAEESIQKKAVLYDKEGDYHFDTISAFIKSIRGSDPDAALYWMATMIRAGEDPRYLFRRMLISASEDIGLADPAALGVVESAAASFDRVGLPEGQFHLAQAALYLATAPKSNSTLAFFDALNSIEKDGSGEVPNHLKDAGRDKEGFGHGAGYMYPHAYRDHWVAQQYLPSGLQGRIFYQPSDQGFEKGIRDSVEKRREIQLSAAVQPEHEEILTFSPPDRQQERWLKRVTDSSGTTLSIIRNSIFESLNIKRHDCILVLENKPPVLLWEAVRKTPEGGVWYMTSGSRASEIAAHHAQGLPEDRRPVEIKNNTDSTGPAAAPAEAIRSGRIFHSLEEGLKFDLIILSDLLTREPDKTAFLQQTVKLLQPGGHAVIHQIIPSGAQRLSALAEVSDALSSQEALLAALKSAEDSIYSQPDNPLVNWNEENIVQAAKESGLKYVHSIETITEKRLISAEDMNKWFEPGGSYGSALKDLLSVDDISRLVQIISAAASGKTVAWQMKFIKLSYTLVN